MKLLVYLCILCACVAFYAGCATPPLSPFPSDKSFQAAEEHFLNGNYAEAINLYQQFIIAQNGKYSDYVPEAYYRMGVSCLASAKYEEAEKNLLEALDNPPYHNRPAFLTLTYQALAQAYQAQNKYRDAISYYRKTIAYNKGDLTPDYLYYNLGICLMRDDQYYEGRKNLELCLQNTEDEADDKLREHALERLSMPANIFTVQLGKFRIKENAANYADELKTDKGIIANVNIIVVEGTEYYYLWSGRFEVFDEARKAADKINEKGIEAVVVP